MDPDSTPSMLQSMSASMMFTTQETLPNFVHPADDKYMCIHCKDILRPPVKQTVCGHRLCATCAEEIFAQNQAPVCPGNEVVCTILNKIEIHPDIAATKELLRMPVYCSFRDSGCPATPKWSKLREHEETCEYETFECHNPGCSQKVRRPYLKRHEQIECEYLQVQCEHCDEYVPKKELHNEHLRTCRPKPRNCTYFDLGCSFQGTPEDLKIHIAKCTEEHSKQHVEATVTAANNNEILKHNLDALASKVNDLSTHETGVEALLAELREEINRISLHADEKADKNEVANISSKLEELQNCTKTQESRLGHLEQASGGGGAMSESMMEKQRHLENTIDAYDVKFTEYETRFRLLETAGYGGKLVWNITQYQRRKKDAIDNRTLSFYSQPFYTSTYGYRMCGRVYLNGDGMGRGSHLSLYFVVMKGEYDALLTWPFRKKVTLALLDQNGRRRDIVKTLELDPRDPSLQRPNSEENAPYGITMFVPLDIVDRSPYLKDNTIAVAITVHEEMVQEFREQIQELENQVSEIKRVLRYMQVNLR